MPNISLASNNEHDYTLYAQYGYFQSRDGHRLYVSVPNSLYNYFHDAPHSISGNSDYSRFVTPDAVMPIAENIRNFTRSSLYSDEEFIDAVLDFVHQIPYVKSQIKYPVETVVDNSGDCDTLSILAASIIKAGGLDVVLFYYKELNHMNLGIDLSQSPHSRWLTPPASYEFDGKKYWVAECTGKRNWKVGDLPDFLVGAQPTIIPLVDHDCSPGNIFSSLDRSPLNSSISIDVSSAPSYIDNEERPLMVSGSISPEYSGQKVLMYFRQYGMPCKVLTTDTDDSGKYSFVLNFTSPGVYYVGTSWSGSSDYAGADSEIVAVFVGFSKRTTQSEDIDASNRAEAVLYRYALDGGIGKLFDVNLTGNGVSLSGNFAVLRTGNATLPERKLTLPETVLAFRFPRGRQIITVIRPAQNVTIPVSMPNGQFGMILQDIGEGNYSINVQKLEDKTVSQIASELENVETTFINASRSIQEDTWYNVSAKMTEDHVTSELHDVNGTLLASTTAEKNGTRTSETGILITYDINTIIVFRGLKAATLVQEASIDSDGDLAGRREIGLVAPQVELTTALIAGVIAVFVHGKMRKKKKLSIQK